MQSFRRSFSGYVRGQIAQLTGHVIKRIFVICFRWLNYLRPIISESWYLDSAISNNWSHHINPSKNTQAFGLKLYLCLHTTKQLIADSTVFCHHFVFYFFLLFMFRALWQYWQHTTNRPLKNKNTILLRKYLPRPFLVERLKKKKKQGQTEKLWS